MASLTGERVPRPSRSFKTWGYQLFSGNYVQALNTMRSRGFRPATLQEAIIGRLTQEEDQDAWWSSELATGSTIALLPHMKGSTHGVLVPEGTRLVERIADFDFGTHTHEKPEAFEGVSSTFTIYTEPSSMLTGYLSLQEYTFNPPMPSSTPSMTPWHALAKNRDLNDYLRSVRRRASDQSLTLRLVLPQPTEDAPNERNASQGPIVWPLVLGGRGDEHRIFGVGPEYVIGEGTLEILAVPDYRSR